MNRVGIVDYGLCNIDSVARAVEELGGRPVPSRDPRELAETDRLILPGVGAFDVAMRHLHELDIVDALTDLVLGEHVPVLGICLGMQLMASWGTEGEPTAGLNWIDARVERLQPRAGERVPHVGWNQTEDRSDCVLFDGIAPDADFYFVHSFHVQCTLDKHVAATTPYAGGFTSAVADGTVFGVQFHPEKSQRTGFALLANFLGV
jgi:glutamine amidotransferase